MAPHSNEVSIKKNKEIHVTHIYVRQIQIRLNYRFTESEYTY